MPTSEAFFEWAKSSSGLHTPQKSFEEKNGRGIFRRFFHFIPVKGPGSVDRSHRKKFDSAKGSSQLHEFVDIGVPGTVSTRRAACHQCDKCWSGDRLAPVRTKSMLESLTRWQSRRQLSQSPASPAHSVATSTVMQSRKRGRLWLALASVLRRRETRSRCHGCSARCCHCRGLLTAT